jgi:hypothetical protein
MLSRIGEGAQVRETNWPDWQPIETAPKDGTAVLVGRAGRYPRVTPSIWSEEMCKWLNMGDQPTHWLPLPPPPQALREKD